MARDCSECDNPALKGEEYCNKCYDVAHLAPDSQNINFDVETLRENDPVRYIVEKIVELPIDDVQELIMMLEADLLIKSRAPKGSAPRRVPTFRWLSVDEVAFGCKVSTLSVEERMLAHYRGTCKNRPCIRSVTRVNYKKD